MVFNVQEQVNAYEDKGVNALQKMQQQNPKLLVGIALENLMKDMQEDQRAKQAAAGGVGAPIIDKKLAGLSGMGGLGQQEAMATAAPGLQQRGQQMQGQQILKALQQAARRPGGMPAAMAQAGSMPATRPGAMPTQRMAMGGIVGYQDGGNVQPIPALMDKYGSEMVMEFLEGEKQLQEESKYVAPQYTAAYQQKADNFYSGFDQGFVSDLLTARSGQSYPKFSSTDELMKYVTRDRPGLRFTGPKPNPEEMAHGGIVGYANRGLVENSPFSTDLADMDIDAVLDAIRQVESGGNPDADSGYAYGAYQINPEAGLEPGYGVEPIDVYNSSEEEQRDYARNYLTAMFNKYGNMEDALQAYNVGPTALDEIQAGRRDMPQETGNYVGNIRNQLAGGAMNEDFVPLSSMADDEGMVSQAVNWAKENPFEAASLGLMFIPGVGWGMAGARGAAMGARALAPRGIAAAKQIGSGIREGARNLFTRPLKSGPGSAVRDPATGQMMRASDLTNFSRGRLGDPGGNTVLPGVKYNRAFSPGRTAAAAGAAGFAGSNLVGDALTPGGPGNNVSPGLAAADRRRTLRENPAIGSLREVGRLQDNQQQQEHENEIALLNAAQNRQFGGPGNNVSPGITNAQRRRTLRENPAIGSLREVGRQQDEGAKGALEYLQSIGRQQQMGADTQDMVNRADPARTLRGIDTDREFESSNAGIMSEADRFSQMFPDAKGAVRRYQDEQAEDELPSWYKGKVYEPGAMGDFAEIKDYLQSLFGFKEGGRVGFQPGGAVGSMSGSGNINVGTLGSGSETDEEEFVPLEDLSDEDDMINKTINWAKNNKWEAASLGLMLVPGLGWGVALGRAGMLGARALAPRGIAALGRAFGPGSKLGKVGQKMFTKPRQYTKDFKIEDPTLLNKAGKPTVLRGKKGFEEAINPRAAVERIPGALKTRRGKPVGGRNPDIRRASAARDPLISPRVFDPLRATGVAATPGAISAGISALGGDEAQAQAQTQVSRDTSNLDRSRPFDVEAFSEAYPELVAEMRQRPLDETQRSYDEQRAALEARRREEARPGIMSQVGNALGSERAQRLYQAMQTLGLGGGAARGQEGLQLMANLETRNAQRRELDALEDKLAVDRENIAAQERANLSNLYAAVYNDTGFQQHSAKIAEEKGLSMDDPEVIIATLAAFFGALPQSPVLDNMGGLDGPTRSEMEAYIQ